MSVRTIQCGLAAVFACSFLTWEQFCPDAAAPFIGFEDVQTTMNIKAMTGVTLSSVTLQHFNTPPPLAANWKGIP